MDGWIEGGSECVSAVQCSRSEGERIEDPRWKERVGRLDIFNSSRLLAYFAFHCGSEKNRFS